MRMRDGLWRLIVFVVGVVLSLTVILLFEFLSGSDSPLMLPSLIASYFIAGGILGFVFPEKGWRSGSWLAFFFVILIIGGALFTAGQIPWKWSIELKGILEDAAIVAAAFFGAALGALGKRRLTVYSRN
jgi:peptidoglycan/LPS O-acetylase OafA/YrhL